MTQFDPTLVDALGANILEKTLAESAIGDTNAPLAMLFEQLLMGALMDLGREVMLWLFAAADSREEVVRSGETWKPKEKVEKAYMTRFGRVLFARWVHHRTRNGATRSFLEERLGIIGGYLTPEAARLSMLLLTDLSPRGAARFLKELGGMLPSKSTLQRLPGRLSQVWEEHREELERCLRESFEIPKKAASVAVMIDGVMVSMPGERREKLKKEARARGQKIGGPVGSREASVGALVYYDRHGHRLETRRFARMPEKEKSSLKSTLRAEVEHVRKARPDLVWVALADGAANIWKFMTSLRVDHQLVDFFHNTEHIKRRLDRTLKPGTLANQKWQRKLRAVLLEPQGHTRVYRSLENLEKRHGTYKKRKKTGRGAQPTFYERHNGRMDYAEHLKKNLPIGSGVIEGTARHIVVDRLRRAGMRWSEIGGQAILTFRAIVSNGQFNTAWLLLMSKLEGSQPLRPAFLT